MTSLRQLIYKGGDAGVTKASVSIVFDNSVPEEGPVGYETHKDITVTRQVRARERVQGRGRDPTAGPS